MLGISYAELIMVAIVALIVMRPDDIKDALHLYRNIRSKMMSFKNQLWQNIKIENDDKKNEQIVIDEDGIAHKAYDIEDLKSTIYSQKKK